MVELVIFWLIFAWLVGFWASRRGRHGGLHFLLALLLSPLVGALIVAILGPTDEKRAAAAAVVERGRLAARASASVGLSADRMAEIEAEERYRAELRGRLAGEARPEPEPPARPRLAATRD